MTTQLEALDRVTTMLSALRGEIEPPEIQVTPAGHIRVAVTEPTHDQVARFEAVRRIGAVLGTTGPPVETKTIFTTSGNGVFVSTAAVPRCRECGQAVRTS